MIGLLRIRGGARLAPALARALSSLPSHTIVPMPALSPTMESGHIGKWRKAEGDSIAPGDIICEVETDKATVDFEAQDDGVVAKILRKEGQEVKVGSPIMVMVDDKSSVAAFANFTLEDALKATGQSAPAAPAAEAPKPQPKQQEAPKPAPAPQAAPQVAPKQPTQQPPAQAPKPAAPAQSEQQAQKPKSAWGSGILNSPLIARLAAQQHAYVEKFGSTGQKPLPLPVKKTK